MKKYILIGLLLAFIVFLFFAYPFGQSLLSILSGYSAKAACSCVFVAERELQTVIDEELAAYNSFIDVEIDEAGMLAKASALGIERKAVFRKGLGCSLLPEGYKEAFALNGFQAAYAGEIDPDSLHWPMGNKDTLNMWPEVNQEGIEKALDNIFTESNPDLIKNTRAALILYKDKIIGERYAVGFDENTPLLGWSMTKSVTNALAGILAKEGKLQLDAPAPVPEWQKKNKDPRKAITLDHLMRMSSGLDFEEVYFGDKDATRMLFLEPSAPAYAIKSKLAHEPGEVWYYSSGTTNIISKIIRDQFDDHHTYLNFPREALFNKLGMRSAQMETDADGTYVGSSFMYATARDWARFGRLFLHDGVWEGERILPKGWVDYSRTRTPSDEYGIYAAQFWTAATKEVGTPMERYWPDLPEDIYYASGFEGQQVVIIPSKDMVLVRLGLTADRAAWDVGSFIREVMANIDFEG